MICDEKYMRRALQLAKNGSAYASPNPMVGAVIVHNDVIIGEGFHRRCGEGHAEVNAVASVVDKSLLNESTIYVTLEPCSHYGKTPPCAKLIIDSGIPNVVIGCLDPFDKVSGRGVKMLQDAGVNVVSGMLEEECKALNRRFITAHALRRPMVTLKWAQSRDGYIDRRRNADEPAARISTPITSMLVHKLRSEHDAILAGSGTVIADNPRLDVRLWSGRSPRIVVIDRSMKIPQNANVFNSNPIYMSPEMRSDLTNRVQWLGISPNADVAEILDALYQAGITSLLVEGGRVLLQSFIDSGLWDNIRVEIAPFDLGEEGSCSAPEILIFPNEVERIDGNEIRYYTK